jgi:hypothetical protein
MLTDCGGRFYLPAKSGRVGADFGPIAGVHDPAHNAIFTGIGLKIGHLKMHPAHPWPASSI